MLFWWHLGKQGWVTHGALQYLWNHILLGCGSFCQNTRASLGSPFLMAHKKQFREQSISFIEHLWKPQLFHKLRSLQQSWTLGLGFQLLEPASKKIFPSLRWYSLSGKTIIGKSPNHKPTNWCQTKDVTVSMSYGFWQVL